MERIWTADGGPRVICLPHAGGSASWFQVWKPAARRLGVTLEAVQYPGHTGMLQTEFARDIEELAELVESEIGNDVSSIHLFGHSMGALVAFETALRVQRRGLRLAGLHCSGSRPPNIRISEPRSQLSDEEFVSAVGALDPDRENALSVPEIAHLFLPIVRHDFKIAESYLSDAILSGTDVDIYAGEDDPEFSPGDISLWESHTTGLVRAHQFPGGHFFLRTNGESILASL